MYICSLWWVSMCLCSCSVWPGCACVSCQVLLRRRRLGGGSLGDPLQFRFGTVSGNPSPNQVTGLGNKWKSVAAQNLSWPPPFFPGSFRPRGVLQRAAIKKSGGCLIWLWSMFGRWVGRAEQPPARKRKQFCKVIRAVVSKIFHGPVVALGDVYRPPSAKTEVAKFWSELGRTQNEATTPNDTKRTTPSTVSCRSSPVLHLGHRSRKPAAKKKEGPTSRKFRKNGIALKIDQSTLFFNSFTFLKLLS